MPAKLIEDNYILSIYEDNLAVQNLLGTSLSKFVSPLTIYDKSICFEHKLKKIKRTAIVTVVL